jgi:hypothetical protein
MTTVTISIVLDASVPSDVEAYVRDTIDNADSEWEIESATIESDGVITDLLEEVDDEADEEADNPEEDAEEASSQEEGTEEKASPTSEPSGKEF